jgi:hypothetical protein
VNTTYEPPLLVPAALVAGTRYACAVFMTSAAALPTLIGTTNLAGVGAELFRPPRLAAVRTPNPTDLPATIPAANLAVVNYVHYFAVAP